MINAERTTVNDSEGAMTSMDEKEMTDRMHAIEVTQATQTATMAGAQATQAATQAGTVTTTAAAHAGTIAAVATGSVALITGMFLGIVLARR